MKKLLYIFILTTNLCSVNKLYSQNEFVNLFKTMSLPIVIDEKVFSDVKENIEKFPEISKSLIDKFVRSEGDTVFRYDNGRNELNSGMHCFGKYKFNNLYYVIYFSYIKKYNFQEYYLESFDETGKSIDFFNKIGYNSCNIFNQEMNVITLITKGNNILHFNYDCEKDSLKTHPDDYSDFVDNMNRLGARTVFDSLKCQISIIPFSLSCIENRCDKWLFNDSFFKMKMSVPLIYVNPIFNNINIKASCRTLYTINNTNLKKSFPYFLDIYRLSTGNSLVLIENKYIDSEDYKGLKDISYIIVSDTGELIKTGEICYWFLGSNKNELKGQLLIEKKKLILENCNGGKEIFDLY